MLAYINVLTGGGELEPGHPSHPIAGGGGVPTHPIVPPPLPGVYPPAGQPTHPIALPPEGVVSNPIVIPGTPEHPITQPPGTIYPPLPPSSTGKYAVLVWVFGVGARWFIVDTESIPQPK
jgi:hypothetical protein